MQDGIEQNKPSKRVSLFRVLPQIIGVSQDQPLAWRPFPNENWLGLRSRSLVFLLPRSQPLLHYTPID